MHHLFRSSQLESRVMGGEEQAYAKHVGLKLVPVALHVGLAIALE